MTPFMTNVAGIVVAVPMSLVLMSVIDWLGADPKHKPTEVVAKVEPKVAPVPKVEPTTDREKFNKVADTIRAQVMCQKMVRAASKFPKEIKFPMWDQKVAKAVWWTDGTDDNRGQVTSEVYAKAMNGLGLMVPMTGECTFQVDIANMKLTVKSVTVNGSKVL